MARDRVRFPSNIPAKATAAALASNSVMRWCHVLLLALENGDPRAWWSCLSLGLASVSVAVSGGHWAVGFVNALWLMTYYDVRLIRSFSKWLPLALCWRSRKRNVLFAWIRQESTFNSLTWHWLRFAQNSVACPVQRFLVINLKDIFILTRLYL